MTDARSESHLFVEVWLGRTRDVKLLTGFRFMGMLGHFLL